MRELTLKIDYANYYHDYSDIINYLLALKGIEDVIIKEEEKTGLININTKYNDEIISDKIIKLEILGFLNLLNYPAVYGFDRHYKGKDIQYINLHYNICCEFCFGNILDILYDTKGIKIVESDFCEKYLDVDSQYTISIYYNPKVISDNKMQDLIKKIDVYG